MESDLPVYEARYGLTGRTARTAAMALGFAIAGIVLPVSAALRIADLAFFGGGGLFVLGVAATRKVALRVGSEGVTLGGTPPASRRGTTVIPWADIEGVIWWRQALPHRSVLWVGLVRRAGAPPLAGSAGRAAARAAAAITSPEISGDTLLASRAVSGWTLDTGRLAAAVAHFAPGVPVGPAAVNPAAAADRARRRRARMPPAWVPPLAAEEDLMAAASGRRGGARARPDRQLVVPAPPDEVAAWLTLCYHADGWLISYTDDGVEAAEPSLPGRATVVRGVLKAGPLGLGRVVVTVLISPAAGGSAVTARSAASRGVAGRRARRHVVQHLAGKLAAATVSSPASGGQELLPDPLPAGALLAEAQAEDPGAVSRELRQLVNQVLDAMDDLFDGTLSLPQLRELLEASAAGRGKPESLITSALRHTAARLTQLQLVWVESAHRRLALAVAQPLRSQLADMDRWLD